MVEEEEARSIGDSRIISLLMIESKQSIRYYVPVIGRKVLFPFANGNRLLSRVVSNLREPSQWNPLANVGVDAKECH